MTILKQFFMKKYLIPFAATFVFLATMSFTVITKNGAFKGKLKPSSDCFAYSDYTNNLCSGATSTLPVGIAPYNPNSCNYSVSGSVSIFPSTYDVTHEATCTGSSSPCCFTVVTTSKSCDMGNCYEVNAIWYEN